MKKGGKAQGREKRDRRNGKGSPHRLPTVDSDDHLQES
jgi:hypothetical protein